MKRGEPRASANKTGAKISGHLPLEHFWHQPARVVAPALLGRWLCRRGPGGVVARSLIVEAEAYCGPRDRASHASRGPTPRNDIMFGPPGFWYVYLCYGTHWLLNLVTGAEGYPAAVLLRGVEGAVGPGRLTRALQVDRAFNRLACAQETGLWIEGAGRTPSGWQRRRGPRIGVDYAGPQWAAKPYRWWLEQKKPKKRAT